MKTKYYIHTINGSPATYDGDQICYAVHYGNPNQSVPTLKQIRAEQTASEEWRTKQGFKNDKVKYGYRRYC